MAKELQVDAQVSGITVYYLIRNTVGQIYNGASFVAYVTANYSTYTITGTEQGSASAYFTGDMPSVAAGTYYIVSKRQAGGSPAETDQSIGWGPMDWDGSAVLPLSGVPGTTSQSNIAATLFRRNMSSDETSANLQSLCNAVLKLTSQFDCKAGGGTAKTYRTDGSTVQMTQAVTTDATLTPIRKLGVGI